MCVTMNLIPKNMKPIQTFDILFYFFVCVWKIGCRWKMQNSWHHRLAHQTPSNWWQPNQDPRTRCPISIACFGSFINENWPHWRCYTSPIRLDPPKGWSSRSSSLSAFHLQDTKFAPRYNSIYSIRLDPDACYAFLRMCVCFQRMYFYVSVAIKGNILYVFENETQFL